MAGSFKKTFLGLASVVPEATQGTPNYSFTASGGTSTTTTVDTTSGLTHDNNIASADDDFFNDAEIYFLPNTTTAALRGKSYPVSDFAVSGSTATFTTASAMDATPASGDTFYVHFPIQIAEIAINEKTENLPRDFVRKTLIGPTSNKGKTAADGSFNFEIWGLETALGSGATPDLDRIAQLLGLLGDITGSTSSRRAVAGTTVSGAGSTTTVVDVTSAANFAVGDDVLINGETAEITGVDTVSTPNNITISPALSAAPANSDVVYFGETHTMFDSGHRSFTLLFLEDDLLHVLTGAVLNLKISGTYNQNIMASIDYQAEGWDQVDSASLNGSQKAKKTIPFVVGAAYFNGTLININSFEFNYGFAIEELQDTGINNRFFVTGADPVCTIVMRNTSVTLKESWEAQGTHADLRIQIGNASSTCIVLKGKAQIQDPASRQAVAGHSYYSAAFAFKDDQTSAATAEKPQIVRF